ncbi:MAG: primosomal protein N' [Candidatus Pelagadaptatus aseana]|uniref:primosomal protein N' n=1 Tax=Candidatus Pelagadaptatus aseana TaxID=3120508 RepID=UPI0039B2F0BF
MSAPEFIQVALPTPLRRTFDYRLPCDDIATAASFSQQLPGRRVAVEFGRQTLTGIIVSVSNNSQYPAEKVKPALQILDDSPLLDKNSLDFYHWAANYYLHPLGEVISAALPAALRQGESANLQASNHWQLTKTGQQPAETHLKRAPKQAQLLGQLQTLQHWSDTELRQLAIPPGKLKPLLEKSLISHQLRHPSQDHDRPLLAQQPLTLNPEQQATTDAIACTGFNAHLIFGATGSGKTEVYLQVLEKILTEGKQALILIPEIGLTPQTIQRFQNRFNRTIAVMHSNLNDTERKQAWLMAAKGIADIVIGTRSAVFTPMPRLGVIMIDEEHDPSFKQQDGFRYHARDLATVRAQRAQIPLLLGSATPALESLHNARQGRYQLARLTQRAGEASAPETQIIDLRGQALHNGFSQQLIQQLQNTTDAGEQALVFLNRRGYSPVMLCHHCGWQAQCPRCETRLTVHQQPPHLHCHHCDYQRPVARQCPECNSHELHYVGQGTERTEQTLQQLFPDTPVIRVDRDSTRRKNGMSEILQDIQTGNPCILVGTQMLAKGHHFPDVTLVAILDADSGLFSTDFRGIERFGQLLLQVSGRAGRAEKPGKVLIQTHLSDHPLLNLLLRQGYDHFSREIQRERQLAKLPPYRAMALLRSESKRADNAHQLLLSARQFLEPLAGQTPAVTLLGPLPAPMEKRNDRYRFQLQLSCDDRKTRHYLCTQLLEHLEHQTLARRVRWSLDIDPQELS